MRYALFIMLLACGEKADDTAIEETGETEEVVDDTAAEESEESTEEGDE